MSARFRKLLYSVVTFLFFGSIAVLLWRAQSNYEGEILLRHTEGAAEQIRIRMEGLMNARLASLKLLAERWVERRPADFSRERFLQFANIFHGHYPGFAGINWMDPDGVVRWVFPQELNALAKDRSVLEHPDDRYRAAFDAARRSLQYQVTPSLRVLQGGMGFDVFLPLLHDGQIQGYLDGVFQIEPLMDIGLAKDVLAAFIITIHEGDQLIYNHGGQRDEKRRRDGFPVVREISFPGKTWRLGLEPSIQAPAVHFPALLFGLTLSIGLAVLLHSLLQRMEMLSEARDHALREVSERKRAEKALQENEKKLEALLAELAAKNAELESFVYTVSHDLKTPIVTIEGFVGALKEDFGDRLSAQGEEYLKFMSHAARKMEMLINDLLELSRVGRLTEKAVSVPLNEIVQEALAVLQPLIQARGIEVAVDPYLPVVHGERKRLVQVLDNLLSNAVKYIGADNEAPRIEIGMQDQDGRLVFFVKDNGIGVDPRYFDKVFQIFQRLPPAMRAGEGTGIGLTIVKRIIELHGGKVWLTSEPGKGSTFYFTLKYEEVQV